jgi:hypothetical protein
MIQTPLIALAERIYRALLALYPADYRLEYGVWMVQVFRDVSRDVYRRQGLAGLVFWWCATLFDLIRTVVEQRRKSTMSKSTLIELTGIFLIVGGVCAAIAAISQLQQDPYNQFLLYAVIFILPAYMLIGLGNVGLALRNGDAAGVWGRLALIVSGVGALILVAAFGLRLMAWNLHYVGLGVHACGALLFGLIHLRMRVLPIPRGLPLLLGLLPLLAIFGIFRTSVEGDADYGSFIYLFGSGLVWLMIGIAVHRQQLQRLPAAI